MGLIAETSHALKEPSKWSINSFLLMNTIVFALAGICKGFDEANIACLVVQSQFRVAFGVDEQSPDEYADTKGWIVSIFTAGAIFGCLACLPVNDRLGRRWSLRVSTLIYAAGVVGQGLSRGNLSAFYASRFIAGFGSGGITVVPAMYISEIAPKRIRGLLAIQYSTCQQLGTVFGFFFNYGITKAYAGHDRQWMLPTLLQLVPAMIWGFGTFLCVESPRWLLYVGRRAQAIATVSRLRGLPDGHTEVMADIQIMESQILYEREAVVGSTQWDLVKELLIPIENRRRFLLVFMSHLFSQWSGASAITQYLPTIFGYLNIPDETASLATGLYAVVKFISCLIFSLLVIDFIGRRRSLMTGITLQITTLVYLACYLGIASTMTAAHIAETPSVSQASTAAVAAIFIHGVGWNIGWYGMPYLIGAEVYPIRIRSLAVSMGMAFHWAFFFGCSRATPDMLEVMQQWGAFAFFACMCFLSLIYVFFAMPDTTGRSLESLDGLFQRPWYTVYQVAYAKNDNMGSVA
ncbi:general substrate transporter [Aspergillus homomorphus CBS 101889]|uniref:General substrate transporter n=1 Tax=Aspergillus homomorphus (strain CBS 101889) TaxID=1450537 RepID=A0A395I4G7_ASPHC|nr:general substrate transporter [Aspergillus homomorphus CBS 101889]RAL14665.1 general substrate transporter [Aspergillus homomorphus CBS 101889]